MRTKTIAVANVMSKFTKGPWKVLLDEPKNQYWDKGGSVYSENLGQKICDVSTLSMHKEANAHLIAASPDMFEVLDSLENDDGSIPEFLWDMRNKVLARARGE